MKCDCAVTGTDLYLPSNNVPFLSYRSLKYLEYPIFTFFMNLGMAFSEFALTII